MNGGFAAKSRSFGDADCQVGLHRIASPVIPGRIRLLPGATDVLKHAIMNVAQDVGQLLLLMRCSCPQANRKRSVGEVFFVSFYIFRA